MNSAAHPAMCFPVEDLLAELDRRVAEGLINRDVQADLALYNYTRKCQYGEAWDEFTTVARGLVVDTAQREIVALPFPKFFNYGERSHALPALPFEVTAKMDGSLGIGFFHDGVWRISTRGRLKSSQSVLGETLLRKHAATSLLNPHLTYLFEIIHPDNRIIIDYRGWEGLVLLSAYDRRDGMELPYSRLTEEAARVSLPPVAAVTCDSVEDLLARAAVLPASEEGFVVRFANNYRVKIKGREYLKRHLLVYKITPLFVCDMIQNGESLDDFRQTLPEELRPNFDAICEIFDRRFRETLDRYREIHRRIVDDIDFTDNDAEYRKRFAGRVMEITANDGAVDKAVLFAIRAERPVDELKKMILKAERPQDNALDGYDARNPT